MNECTDRPWEKEDEIRVILIIQLHWVLKTFSSALYIFKTIYRLVVASFMIQFAKDYISVNHSNQGKACMFLNTFLMAIFFPNNFILHFYINIMIDDINVPYNVCYLEPLRGGLWWWQN